MVGDYHPFTAVIRTKMAATCLQKWKQRSGEAVFFLGNWGILFRKALKNYEIV